MNSKNNKGIKIVGGSLLTLAIVALLSITYANYTATLKISGAGTLKSAKWDISFSDQAVKTEKHSAESGYESDVVEGTASADGTTLSITNAALKRPGDNITYEFEVENKGDFDAILSAANTTLNCQTEGEDNQTEECKKHIKVSLLDSTGTSLAESDGTTSYSKSDDVKHKLLHTSSTKEKFKLKIEYKKDSDSTGATLPTKDIKISEFGATLTYVQATSAS